MKALATLMDLSRACENCYQAVPAAADETAEMVERIAVLEVEQDETKKRAQKFDQLLENLEDIGWPCSLEELPKQYTQLSLKIAALEAERDCAIGETETAVANAMKRIAVLERGVSEEEKKVRMLESERTALEGTKFLLEYENTRLREFMHWIRGATDARLDPIMEMINDRAALAGKE